MATDSNAGNFVSVNGTIFKFVPGSVPVSDRGFLYGDGLFETMQVREGEPARWTAHLERMMRGAEFLKIAMPFTEAEMREKARELIVVNRMPEAVLRMTLSRGSGGEGYSTKGAGPATLVMALRRAPAGLGDPYRVVISKVQLPPGNELSQFKTCNKLPQILARMEADEKGADEALLLSTTGGVVEASAANLFWVRDGVVGTAPVSSGVLPGIGRATVLEVCSRLGIETREGEVTTSELMKAEGVFFVSSARGVVEVGWVDGKEVGKAEVVERIADAVNG